MQQNIEYIEIPLYWMWFCIFFSIPCCFCLFEPFLNQVPKEAEGTDCGGFMSLRLCGEVPRLKCWVFPRNSSRNSTGGLSWSQTGSSRRTTTVQWPKVRVGWSGKMFSVSRCADHVVDCWRHVCLSVGPQLSLILTGVTIRRPLKAEAYYTRIDENGVLVPSNWETVGPAGN